MTGSSRGPSGVVTLLTDFGTRDPFVGVMKGVLLAFDPHLRIVDLTHEVPPQHIATGAFWLARSFRYFPQGTVHVVVVDPGVGTARRALVLAASDHYFVGPDNGVLSSLMPHASEVRCIDRAFVQQELAARLPFADGGSATFHGRDVFAPAAAWIARGGPLADLGPPLADPAVVLPPSPPRVEIVDHFGNLITNLDWRSDCGDPGIEIRGRRLRWVRTYGEARPGEWVALLGSFGTVEIAVRDGSAARELEVGPGETLRITSPVH